MKHDPTSSVISRQNFRQARVLIIEHDLDQLATIERCMREHLPEVEPIRAVNEEQALTYLTAYKFDEWRLPKMILLDAFMPHREDGWRILRRIKELPTPVNQIPLVVLSHQADAADVSEAYERGSASYLVKPASADEWPVYFQMLRQYWWETVSLPHTDYRY